MEKQKQILKLNERLEYMDEEAVSILTDMVYIFGSNSYCKGDMINLLKRIDVLLNRHRTYDAAFPINIQQTLEKTIPSFHAFDWAYCYETGKAEGVINLYTAIIEGFSAIANNAHQ